MKNKTKEIFNINNQIRSYKVRVIDNSGIVVGVMDKDKAILMAKNEGLDLVEISSGEVSTCRIADYGKMKYQLQKKKNDAKKKQKNIEIKEVKFSVNIGKGDYNNKISKIEKFISKGNKVKMSIRIRGREIQNMDVVNGLVSDIKNDIQEYAKFYAFPKLVGRQIIGGICSISSSEKSK